MIQARTVILTSNEPWGDVWYSKQHYANELSKTRDVWFLNPPSRWKPWHLFSWKLCSRKVSDNLTVLDYHNNLPSALWPRLIWLNDRLLHWRLKRHGVYSKKPVLFWLFDAFRLSSFPIDKDHNSIYHVVDPYHGNRCDQKLAQQSDLIVCVNSKYLPFYQKYKSKVMVVPHGVSAAELEPDACEVASISKRFGRFALLIGNMSHDLDLSVLTRIADEQPDHALVLVGPNRITASERVAEFRKLLSRSNVYYVGAVHANQLKNYVSASAVCLAPYNRQQQESRERTPLKIVNYLAQKKPIVCTLTRVGQQLLDKAIYCAASPDEFVSLVKQAQSTDGLEVDTETVEARLREIQYPSLIDSILLQLDSQKPTTPDPSDDTTTSQVVGQTAH